VTFLGKRVRAGKSKMENAWIFLSESGGLRDWVN